MTRSALLQPRISGALLDLRRVTPAKRLTGPSGADSRRRYKDLSTARFLFPTAARSQQRRTEQRGASGAPPGSAGNGEAAPRGAPRGPTQPQPLPQLRAVPGPRPGERHSGLPARLPPRGPPLPFRLKKDMVPGRGQSGRWEGGRKGRGDAGSKPGSL